MEEREALEALLRAHGCTLAEERRARIALLADEGCSTTEIGRELCIDADTVSRWRGRIAKGGVGEDVRAALADAPRSGRPRSIDAVQRAQIVATACDPLPDGQGLSGWTLDLLLEDLSLRGIEAPSRSSVHRILTDVDVQPQRYRLWLHS
ncbi:MAG: helix-turn-helix domain-containing protein, partial [Gaiellaceae bacterium]